jgi:hypothetical protein
MGRPSLSTWEWLCIIAFMLGVPAWAYSTFDISKVAESRETKIYDRLQSLENKIDRQNDKLDQLVLRVPRRDRQ